MSFKVGDKVKCIDTDGCSSFLTKGKSYVLTTGSYEEDGTVYIGVVDDINRNIKGMFESRFELVETEKENSMQVNYIIAPNATTVTFNGKVHTILNTDHRYNAVMDTIRDDKLESIPDLLDVAKSFNQDGYELVDGVIHVNGKAIDHELTDKVLAFKRDRLPTDYLLKFAEKIQENPSFNSRKMLYKFLEHNGHPITKDGNFIAYKKVKENFKDCHTGTMDNSIGTIVSMDRDLVDDNPNNTCSSGLHVAAFNYAQNFSSGHLIEVEIDPKDVVSVPNDYNGEKMRVCKYIVRSICESKLNTEIYEEDETEELTYECGAVVDIGDNVTYEGYDYEVTDIYEDRETV